MSKELEEAEALCLHALRSHIQQHPNDPRSLKWKARMEENQKLWGFPITFDDMKELVDEVIAGHGK